MLSGSSVKKTLICCILLLLFQYDGKIAGTIQDDTTSRANTLFDDADDIQRQLDNEARDKMGHFKTVWVLQDPSSIKYQYTSTTQNTTSNDIVRLRRKRFKKYKHTREPVMCQYIKMPEQNCSSTCGCGCCGKLNDQHLKSSDENEEPAYISPPKWHFWEQNKWHEKFQACGGRAQSPVNLPVKGLIRARGARKLAFYNYAFKADNLTVVNDGDRVIMYGHWPKNRWPLVCGGAAYSRRYLFHSLSIYWPSEHSVGGLFYPMETQLLHISSEYGSFDEAVEASSKDPMAFLGIVNIYKYSNFSHPGLMLLLETASKCRLRKLSISPTGLDFFSTPFTEYVCYYGSLTMPPCTESVLWLVRRRSLPISRECNIDFHQILGPAVTSYTPTGDTFAKAMTRLPQPLNDRKIYVFV